MTDAVAERFWAEFESEASEHLEIVEAGLMAFVEGNVSDYVAPLFRAFHSLKGLARAMGLSGMEQAAHAAESVLQYVRDKNAAAGLDVVNALFLGHDTLRKQLASAITKREDSATPQSVLTALHEQQQRLAEQYDQEIGDDLEAVAEGDNAEEMLNLFGELVQGCLPQIAGLFAAKERAEIDAVGDALAELANAASVMEFDILEETANRLADAVRDGLPPTRSDGWYAAIQAYADLLMNVRVLEDMMTMGDAATVLSDAAVILTADASDALSDLAFSAAAMNAAVAGNPAMLGDVMPGFRQALVASKNILYCIGADQAVDLLVFIEDLCVRIDAGLDNVVAMAAIAGAIDDVATASDLFGPAFDDAFAELRRRIAGADSASDEAMIAGVKVGDDMRSLLSEQDIERLRAALLAGQTAYRWSLYLEDSQDTANTIIGWISRSAVAIHSRTVIRDDKSWFEFLLTAEITVADVPALLMRLDPGRLCIRKVVVLDASEGGTSLLDESPKPVDPQRASDVTVERSQGIKYFRVRSDAVESLIGNIGALRSRLADLEDIFASRETPAGNLKASADPQTFRAGDIASERGLDMLKSVQRAAEKIEAEVFDLQVVALEIVFQRLPRIVHALAEQQGKHVQLALDHGGVRVDKAIVDVMLEPLVHLITNAVDHGIEPGAERSATGKLETALVSLRARRAGRELVITIKDDGRGMDESAIRRAAVARGIVDDDVAQQMTSQDVFRLTLKAGFSTASKLTDVSGRGVGLDVVATTIQRLGGSVEIDSVKGEGTTFLLRLPLSRSLQTLILVEAAGQVYAFNERSVKYVMACDGAAASFVSTPIGEVKVLMLSDMLWHSQKDDEVLEERPILVIASEGDALGVGVSKILGRRNVALKTPDAFLAASGVIAGASTLVDGTIVLVLDAKELIAGVREGKAREASTLVPMA